MAIEINIPWSISLKAWDRAGIELITPGSAVRHISATGQFNDCVVSPSMQPDILTTAVRPSMRVLLKLLAVQTRLKVRPPPGPILLWSLIVKHSLSSADSRRVVVSYKGKYLHEVLVDHFKSSLSRKKCGYNVVNWLPWYHWHDHSCWLGRKHQKTNHCWTQSVICRDSDRWSTGLRVQSSSGSILWWCLIMKYWSWNIFIGQVILLPLIKEGLLSVISQSMCKRVLV